MVCLFGGVCVSVFGNVVGGVLFNVLRYWVVWYSVDIVDVW